MPEEQVASFLEKAVKEQIEWQKAHPPSAEIRALLEQWHGLIHEAMRQGQWFEFLTHAQLTINRHVAAKRDVDVEITGRGRIQ